MSDTRLVHTYLGATTMRSFLAAAQSALCDQSMTTEERMTCASAEIEGAQMLLDSCTGWPYLTPADANVMVTRTHRLVPDPDPNAALGFESEPPA